jgi:hypothetical protein
MADETEKEKPDPTKTKRKWYQIVSDAMVPGKWSKSMTDDARKKMDAATKREK